MTRYLFLLLLFPLVFASCFLDKDHVRGNGNIRTENRSVGSFARVSVGGAIKLYVTQAQDYSVRIETDENLLELVETEVSGDELKIRPRQRFGLNPSGEIKVYVSAPVFKRLDASGACNIYSQGRITLSETLDIDLSGASYAEVDLRAPAVEADLSGASTVQLSGETKDFNLDGSGASTIRCYELKAENVDVELSGSSHAEVFASVKLDAHASGAAGVSYRGNGALSQHVSGAGTVKKVD
ncbi:MAG: head GIN domain-containing protein [Chitinophagaceae bacterium]